MITKYWTVERELVHHSTEPNRAVCQSQDREWSVQRQSCTPRSANLNMKVNDLSLFYYLLCLFIPKNPKLSIPRGGAQAPFLQYRDSQMFPSSLKSPPSEAAVKSLRSQSGFLLPPTHQGCAGTVRHSTMTSCGTTSAHFSKQTGPWVRNCSAPAAQVSWGVSDCWMCCLMWQLWIINDTLIASGLWIAKVQGWGGEGGNWKSAEPREPPKFHIMSCLSVFWGCSLGTKGG